MSPIKPLGDKLIVKRLEAEDTTSGGLIIPDTAKDKPMKGEVLAAGPGKRDANGVTHPIPINVGDTIVFSRWTPVEFKLDGEEFLIIREEDVLGIYQQKDQ